jgi:hypothetical protein
MGKYLKMDFGWTYGSSWQKSLGMIKDLFKYKCPSVSNDKNLSKCEFSKRISNGMRKSKSLSSKTFMKSEIS